MSSAVIYGVECWTLTNSTTKKLEALDHKQKRSRMTKSRKRSPEKRKKTKIIIPGRHHDEQSKIRALTTDRSV